MAPLSFSRGEKRGKENINLLEDHTSRRHVERAIGCKLQSKQDQKLLENFAWAIKMMQKARSKGETAWASRQVEKAQAKISGGWLKKLEAKAKAARATKSEWEQAGAAELQYKEATRLQAEMKDIHDSIAEATQEAEEATRLLQEKTQQDNASQKQNIEQLEERLLQIKKATEAQGTKENEPPTGTVAIVRQSTHTQHPTPNVNPQDLHTGRTLAAQMRIDKAQRQREAVLEGMRWGSPAYWQDKIRECFFRAKATKYFDEARRFRAALNEIQDSIVQPDDLVVKSYSTVSKRAQATHDNDKKSDSHAHAQWQKRLPAENQMPAETRMPAEKMSAEKTTKRNRKKKSKPEGQHQKESLQKEKPKQRDEKKTAEEAASLPEWKVAANERRKQEQKAKTEIKKHPAGVATIVSMKQGAHIDAKVAEYNALTWSQRREFWKGLDDELGDSGLDDIYLQIFEYHDEHGTRGTEEFYDDMGAYDFKCLSAIPAYVTWPDELKHTRFT